MNCLVVLLLLSKSSSFVLIRTWEKQTSLNAIGVLARKAKEALIEQWKESGDIPKDIEDKVKEMKEDYERKESELQKALTKRRGTITVIAEYKRKLDKGGFIDETLDPEILSPKFREFGASAIAVMADEQMGGCTYDDLKVVKEEQESARGDVPGPLYVISSDLIVDEIQLAQASVAGADAVLLNLDALGTDKCTSLFHAAKSIGLDVLVGITTKEQAQQAVTIGANILCVYGHNVDQKADIIQNLTDVCTVAVIYARDTKQLEEVEEAWMLRDKGFNAVWASDCLYKYGQDHGEHPGAIIRSMKSKSSLKYASPKAISGRGEGAREYLGDIMM